MSNDDSSGYGLNDMPPIRGNTDPNVARASQQRRASIANPYPVHLPTIDNNRGSDTESEDIDNQSTNTRNQNEEETEEDDDDDVDDNDSFSDMAQQNGNVNMNNHNNNNNMHNSISPGIGHSDYNNMHLENQNLPTHNDKTVAQSSLKDKLSPTVMFATNINDDNNNDNNMINNNDNILDDSGNILDNNNNNSTNFNLNDNIIDNGTNVINRKNRTNPFKYNEYSPHNILPSSTFHRRNDTNHSRSHTTAVVGFNNPNMLIDKPPTSHRRTKSQLDGRRGKQKNDHTFMCTRIEERMTYKTNLSESNYLILLNTIKKVITNNCTKYGGNVAIDRLDNENNIGKNRYDFMIQFASVHAAIECAVAIQVSLNELNWPQWFKEFENNAKHILNYSGQGPLHVFNGVRICISLHTARESVKVNPYDNCAETLTRAIEPRGLDSWDVEYTGTAIDLVQNLCYISFGGEILASKAVQEAYNRDRGKNQRTADKVFIQQLGSHHFENLRKVDLVQFTPQELQAREFPQRQFHSSEEEAKKSNQMSALMAAIPRNMTGDEYDPFPKGSDEESSSQEDADTMKRQRQNRNNNNDNNNDSINDNGDGNRNSHKLTARNLAKNNRENERRLRRKAAGNNGNGNESEHSSDNEERRTYHYSDPSQKHLDLDNLDLEVSDDEKHLNQSMTPHTEASALSIPKPPEPSRSKQKEILKRRNSLSASSANTPVATTSSKLSRPSNDNKHDKQRYREQHSHSANVSERGDNDNDDAYDNNTNNNNNNNRNRQSSRNPDHSSAEDDEDQDEDDDEFDDNAPPIPGPPTAIRNKKRELEITRTKSVLNMESAAYGAVNSGVNNNGGNITPLGSETSSKHTSSSYRKMKLQVANPKQMLLYYEARPPDLPGEYGIDQEFVCLNCNLEKKWIDGVWRSPMWPSFDVCSECASTVLSMSHQAYNKRPPRHLTAASDAAMLQNQATIDTEELNEHQSNEKLIHSLRKELSTIIEMLTDLKLRRLKNIQDWCLIDSENGSDLNNGAGFANTIDNMNMNMNSSLNINGKNTKEFIKHYRKAQEDFGETEVELATWRKFQTKQDIQDQKLKRRQSAMEHNLSPNASDLDSDEELIANFEEYNPHNDLNIIHKRINGLNNLFWVEDDIFRKKINSANKVISKKSIENDFANVVSSNGNNNADTSDSDNNNSKNDGHLGVGSTNITNQATSGNLRSDLSSDDEDGNDESRMAPYTRKKRNSIQHGHGNDGDDGDDMRGRLKKVQSKREIDLENKLHSIQEQTSQEVSIYISQIHRKDTELHQAKQEIERLRDALGDIEENGINNANFSDMSELQQENMQLKQRINDLIQNMYDEDEPDHGKVDNDEVEKLQQAISNLEKERQLLTHKLRSANDDVDRLAKSKIDLIEGTSHQIERLRDEICNLNDKLQIQTIRVEELSKLRATYEREEEKSEVLDDELAEGALSNTQNYLSRASNSFWSMGRSRFSTPLWKQTVTDTNESKIKLAQETGKEIQRLRDIIKVLSNAPMNTNDRNTYGNNNKKNNDNSRVNRNNNNNDSNNNNRDDNRNNDNNRHRNDDDSNSSSMMGIDTLGRKVKISKNNNNNENDDMYDGDREHPYHPNNIQNRSMQNKNKKMNKHKNGNGNVDVDGPIDNENNNNNNDGFVMDDEKEAPPAVDRMTTSIVWKDKHNPNGGVVGVPMYEDDEEDESD